MFIQATLSAAVLLASMAQASAVLPFDKIRGVNLGSLFVIEPWMASNTWQSMGCGDSKSEFDCMSKLGKDAGNAAFQQHWASWITEDDIIIIKNWGLNTVRIPVGYWIVEDIVYKDEPFATGGFAQLTKVLGDAEQPFTGQYASSPGFYQDYQYQRAFSWAANITTSAHAIPEWSYVMAIEAVNEPLRDASQAGLVDYYYQIFEKTVRDAEAAQGVSCGDAGRMAKRRRKDNGKRSDFQCLIVTYMDANWGGYDPTRYLASTQQTMYNSHSYVKYVSDIPQTRQGYLDYSCQQNTPASEPGNSPLFVGEYSLSPDGDNANPEFDTNAGDAISFYQRFFKAQVMAANRGAGHIFWSYKTELGDYRWSYKDAVAAGVIPTNLQNMDMSGVC